MQKAKVQIAIGLITTAVSILGILVLFTELLFYHITQRAPCAPYIIFPLGLILPVIYGVFLIRKKLKHVRVIFWVWVVSWIITMVFMFLGDVVYYRWLQQSLPGTLDTIAFLLELIIGFPSFAFLFPIIDISNVSSIAWRETTGVIVLLLLWIGLRGLEQIKKMGTEGLSHKTNGSGS
jgi:hypothetical protein